jgi:hypothetical protein
MSTLVVERLPGEVDPVTQCVTITDPTQFQFLGHADSATITFNGVVMATLNAAKRTWKTWVLGEYCITINGKCSAAQVVSDPLTVTVDVTEESDPLIVCSVTEPTEKLVVHPRYEEGVFSGWFNSAGAEVIEGVDFVVCPKEMAFDVDITTICADKDGSGDFAYAERLDRIDSVTGETTVVAIRDEYGTILTNAVQVDNCKCRACDPCDPVFEVLYAGQYGEEGSGKLPFIANGPLADGDVAVKTGMAHFNPYYDGAAYNHDDGKLYVVSPNIAPSYQFSLTSLDIASGTPTPVADYVVAGIVGYGGSSSQVAVNAGAIRDGVYYGLMASTVVAPGRVITIDLDTLVATDIGEANLPYNNYRELVFDDLGNMYAYNGDDIFLWDGAAFGASPVGTPFTHDPDCRMIGGGFWLDGEFYNVLQCGPTPVGPFTYQMLKKTLGGDAEVAFEITGLADDMWITDATVREI